MRARYYMPEALLLSFVYSRRMKRREFTAWSKSIGEPGVESPKETAADLRSYKISRAVTLVCDHVPWESKCMVRALTAKKMLNRRGYPCTLYMGVKNDENGSLEAHAWLRLGAAYVTGGNGAGYTVTGKYGDRGKEEKR